MDYYQIVYGDYFQTMRIPHLEGRAFGAGDDAGFLVVDPRSRLARMGA